MKRHIPAFLIAMTALAFTSSCGNDNSTISSTGDATDQHRGSQVYTTKCASCHGADLRGTDKGPSHLSVVYEPGHHTDESFRSAIENGAPQHHWPFGDMPAIEGLSAGDIEAVIAYVRSEQQRQGFDQ